MTFHNISTKPIFMMHGPLLSHYKDSTQCHNLIQVRNMPPSVTGRYWHSMSTIAVSHNCAWLMVIGDDAGKADFVLLELSE